MAPRTLGGVAGSRPASPVTTQQPAAAPARQPAPAAPQAAPQSPPSGRSSGRGLPPPPAGWHPQERSGGGFTRKTDKEWDASPPAPGDYDWDVYVSSIIAWATGGVSLKLRVSQWDRATNRSGEHHGRPLGFDPYPGQKLLDRLDPSNDADDRQKAETAYGNWRHDLVTAYTGAGFPESSWQSDETGPVPPWDRFFVHQHQGVWVPVMLRARVNVWRGSSRSFINVRGLERVVDSRTGNPFQAMLPREVPADIARMYGWRVAEERVIEKTDPDTNVRQIIARVSVLDKDCVRLGHGGLPTYKDL